MVRTGLDNFRNAPPLELKGKRLGLLSNAASVDSHFRHAKEIIDGHFPGRLRVMLSPQHGFHAEKQDNMIESNHGRDKDLGIPIYSLYRETRKPSPEMLDPIDILLVDLQDVGTRVYTFFYTLSYCLEAMAELGKTVVVLDRPNPIGGVAVEGNLLGEAFRSFVGRYPIPMRHGLTIGELAQYVNERFQIRCDVKIIPMTGWKRSMYFEDTGLPWVLPSPNLPTPGSCRVYPGQVIWEGTNISEGRGTTLPFEQFGAPFLDPDSIRRGLETGADAGVVLRTTRFEPTSGKHAGNLCNGFQIHVTDRTRYRPYRLSLCLLQRILQEHGDEFQWKQPPYEYEYETLPIDLIIGNRKIREQIENHIPLAELEESWREGLDTFCRQSRPYRRYS